jgi:SAM-dependent methyltransferase
MDSEIVAESEAREIAAIHLQRIVAELCAAIVLCEAAQLTRKEIADVLMPLQRTAADLRPLPHNAFELVLADGIFDSLTNDQAVLLLQRVHHVLAPGGTFVFTTIAADDPHRALFDHLGDTPLVARSEEKLYECFDSAGISRQNVTLRREERGRALRIEVQKLQ